MTPGNKLLAGLSLLCLFSFAWPGWLDTSKKSKQAEEAAAPAEAWITETVPEGGSIFSVLESSGLPLREIGLVSYHFGEYVDVTTIQPGDTLKVRLDAKKRKVADLVFIQEPTVRHVFIARGDSLAYFQERLPVQTRLRLLEGRLEGTLDASLLALGLLPGEKQQINNGLEAEINFARDAKAGDTFNVFLQERAFEGQKLPGGKILYVSYRGEKTGIHELFRYEDPEEKSVLSGLYTSAGKSNDTSGVGFPLSSIHVISPFGRRIDPIYRSWRAHQGVDYRARYGTPVFAVANGTVTSSRYNGGWGNEVTILHPSGLTTQYAHLSSLQARKGQSVRRGQIIGRVGSTGKSTGAHLHFGLLRGKQYINPTNLKMVGAEKLEGERLQEFQKQIRAIRGQMASLALPA